MAQETNLALTTRRCDFVDALHHRPQILSSTRNALITFVIVLWGGVLLSAQPTIATALLPYAISGHAYSAALIATGGSGTGYVWSLPPGSSLPFGFALSAAGILSSTGSPAAPVQLDGYTFNVQVTDSVNTTTTAPIFMAVWGAVSENQADAAVQTTFGVPPWNIRLELSPPYGPFLWEAGGTCMVAATITQAAVDACLDRNLGLANADKYFRYDLGLDSLGALPPGVPITQEVGYPRCGIVPMQGTSYLVCALFLVSPPSLQITTKNLPNATSHEPYSTTLVAAGGSGTGYTWSLASGSLPNGFSLNPAGLLSTTGTPAAAQQSYGVTVKVTDSGGDAATQQLTLVVISPPLPAVTILDPVPQLLNGPQITNSRSTLAASGRQVQGIAADGIAQVVFRIPALAALDQVTATLLTDQCATPGTPSTCSPSGNSDNDGGLFNVGGPVTAAQSLPNNAGDAVDTETLDAFIAYRAPIDFVRSTAQTNVACNVNPTPTVDACSASRMVYLSLSYSSGGTVYGSQIVPLAIVRPPVILVHGNWSTPVQDWSYFHFLESPPFQSTFVNYSSFLSKGVHIAAEYVLPQISGAVDAFKSGSISLPTIIEPCTSCPLIPVAAVQADLVSYSLGGLVSRALVTLSNYTTSGDYGAGYVHKLITLDTPHTGSQFATNLLLSENCQALFSANDRPVGENIIDIAPGSGLLRQLQTVIPHGIHLATAVIVSAADSAQETAAYNEYFSSIFFKRICPGLLPGGGFQALFMTPMNPSGSSDLVVSQDSQQATNLAIPGMPISIGTTFSGIIHAIVPGVFPMGPDVRQGNLQNGSTSIVVGIPPPFASTEQVLMLINTPISQFGRIAP